MEFSTRYEIYILYVCSVHIHELLDLEVFVLGPLARAASLAGLFDALAAAAACRRWAFAPRPGLWVVAHGSILDVVVMVVVVALLLVSGGAVLVYGRLVEDVATSGGHNRLVGRVGVEKRHGVAVRVGLVRSTDVNAARGQLGVDSASQLCAMIYISAQLLRKPPLSPSLSKTLPSSHLCRDGTLGALVILWNPDSSPWRTTF